jgi:ribosomal protein S6
VIKEYLEEVRTDHPSWKQMPKRMLRHRAIQQCARLALEISGKDYLALNIAKVSTGPYQLNQIHIRKNQTNLLKKKLSENI